MTKTATQERKAILRKIKAMRPAFPGLALFTLTEWIKARK